MGKDYYKLLGVPRSADPPAVRAGYRREALKWHPDKHQEDKEVATAKFQEVAEAWDVLSDPEKKTIYDECGEEGLKGCGSGGGGSAGGGAQSSNSGSTGPDLGGFAYRFTADPDDIFARFFKDSYQRANSFGQSPFENFFSALNAGAAGGLGSRSSQPSGDGGLPRQHLVDLQCSLEDLYVGTRKKMKIRRRSRTLLRDAERVLEVDVRPGWKAGTKVTFAGEGDELGGSGIAQDVVFVIRERKHEHFAREGSNLLHLHRIALVDALTGCDIEIPTLDKRVLTVSIQDTVVTPNYTKVVKGEGMPSTKPHGNKGDMVITFDIAYPQKLTDDQKASIKEALPRE